MALEAVGSNPIAHPKKSESKDSDFFIRAAGFEYHHSQSAVHIIKGGSPPLYLITRQRASFGSLKKLTVAHFSPFPLDKSGWAVI